MRRLFSIIFAVIITGMALPSVLVAGGMHVSGDVSGIWPAGEVVTVDAPIYVLPDKGLIIEPGVRVRFKTSAAIRIQGSFEASGTSDSPIELDPMEGWAGFQFENHGNDIRVLQFVVIGSSAGVPTSVVTATNSLMNIQDCNFTAHESCLWMIGGRIWAERNFFETETLHSKAVHIESLYNDYGSALEACHDSLGNHLTDNIIRVDVPFTDPDLDPWAYTIGLRVINSTNTCFDGNTISVSARGNSIGAYFMIPADSAVYSDWWVEFNAITVHGYMGTARGIQVASQGTLNLVRCTVDVAGGSPSWPVCVVASDHASAVVNSSIVQLDRGTNFFMGMTSGTIAVDYSDQWLQPGATDSPGMPDDGGRRRSEYSTETVIYGSHMYSQNPNLRHDGRWGVWQSAADVQAYYEVLPPSPCIDNGDIHYSDRDPDNTLPDIGRFYYPHGPNNVGSGIAAEVANLTLSPVFPNPFNATTIVPLTLNKAGHVVVSVHNLLGQDVGVLVSGNMNAGQHNILFSGESLPSGLYIVSVKLNGALVASQKAMLLK